MIIAASLMCADFWNLGEQIRQLEAAGVDALHFDVMDGAFVPNLGVGPQVFLDVRRHTTLPCDVHLMVSNAAAIIPLYEGAQWILVHPEAAFDRLHWLLDDIARRGSRPGVALNPATDPSVLEWVVDRIQMVLLMTVNPGFAGQPFIPQMVRKVRSLRHFLDGHGRKDVIISIDGHVNAATVPALAAAGAGMLIGGSSGLFLPGGDFAAALRALRAAASSTTPG